MKIIENKKLFGRVNVFDFVILVVLLCVGIFAYRYLYAPSIKVGSGYFETNCKIKLDKLPLGVFERVKAGDLLYDNETNTYIGKVVSAEKREYVEIIEDYENKKYVEAIFPDKETVIVTVEVSVNGTESDLITANNYYIKVGKALHVRGPSYAGSGHIVFIDR